jgi:F420-non-reducing hydrogenase iron-sulfur subunit
MADLVQRGKQNPPGQGGPPPKAAAALKEGTITETVAGKGDVLEKKGPFQPRVAAICCNWCTWSSLDEAGVGHHKFPAEVSVIRTLCSARIEPRNVINLFREGVDGVFVGACAKGSCHYLAGTNLAQKELGQLMEVISAPSFGFGGRLKIGFFVGREGALFARALTEFVSDVRAKGPSPLNTSPTYRDKPAATAEPHADAETRSPPRDTEGRLVDLEEV